MSQPDADPRRERARELYLAGELTLREISARLDLPKGTISGWATRYDWPRRKPRPPPDPDKPHRKRLAARRILRRRKRPTVETLVDRLYRIVTHNMELMEIRMSDEEIPEGDTPERNMRVVGTMVRSVEKLKELETEQSNRDNAPPAGRYIVTPEEEERIRRKVVEHIQRLRERKRAEGTKPPD